MLLHKYIHASSFLSLPKTDANPGKQQQQTARTSCVLLWNHFVEYKTNKTLVTIFLA